MFTGTNEEEMNRLEELKRIVREGNCTPGQISKGLAVVFGVRSTEVGLMFRHEYFLKFLYPVELQSAGSIPLSGSAVAARTATSKKSDIFNNFARVPHRSIFETIKLKDSDAPQPIQKLISAPVLGSNGDVVGVVQISRKGYSAREAGVDFTRDDLLRLEEVARILAPFLTKLYKPEPAPHVALKVQGERPAPIVMPKTAVAS